MPEDKELIRKRASIKGKVTVFVNYLNTLQPSSLSDIEVSELQFRFNRFEALYDQYDEVQLALECSIDNLTSQISDRSEFESLYYKTLSQAQKMLDDNKRGSFNDKSELDSHSSNHKFVKLPTIQLPKFSGLYTNWLEFHDTFVSLIHSNDDMNEINKFHYLRSSLEGSAAVVINSIQFSAANYSIAWNLLCERFDNKNLLIQHHISALFQIDSLQRESSVNLKGLLDVINKNLRALESLGEPVSHWDTLLIYIVTHKLDNKTYREWEEYKGCLAKDTKITFNLFITFIKNRAEILETLELVTSTSTKHSITSKNSNKVRTMMSQNSTTNTAVHNSRNDSCFSNKPKSCVMCSNDHKLSICPQFLSLSNADRFKLLPKYKICYNCFNPGHYANNCKKLGCKICRRKHNTLVHVNNSSKSSMSGSTDTFAKNDNGTSSMNISTQPIVDSLALSASVDQCDVLLSTVLLKVTGINGQQHIVRAVLDSGSTSCLMTEKVYFKLGLTAKTVNNSILGINNASSLINKLCYVSVQSLQNNFSTNINCYIIPIITDKIPSTYINLSKIKIPPNVGLADPNFHSPSPVDMLLGADIFWDLLGSEKIKLGDGLPILCETKLGWIVSGPILSVTSSKVLKCNFTNVLSDYEEFNSNIDRQLTRFWQLEDVCTSSPYSSEEKQCEKHFTENTTRLDNGRFCVRIPLKSSPDHLGESLSRAKYCFSSLERKFKCKTQFSKMYKEFMLEYEALNHMSKCKNIEDKAFYIPHHGVLRESSATTKLRVVFNASSLTSTGTSFNNIQMVGPVVQDDLLSILLRFRQHKYILAADIEKMYRQIVVHPSDRYLQQIIWRDNLSSPLQAYQLNTVTYGTASAPFLATRCLRQLGLDLKDIDRQVSEVIIHDFYVDDLLTGGDDLNEVIALRHKVTSTLASAQMNLRKWKSNEIQLVMGSDVPQSSLDLNIGGFESNKTLGLGWDPLPDYLCFPIGESIKFNNTKRDMLSIISQVFDPLGLLAPYIITMKMLLQKLWLEKLSWDEQLSPDNIKVWNEVIINLPKLNLIRIPRRILVDSYDFLEFHIFTDASERAYGACLYVRSVASHDEPLVRLLLAKSRVAPLKPMTIPRLELCGALVGVRIYEKVIAALRVTARRIFFWTDSTVVLGWLNMLPHKLQPFVRNRVAEVLDKSGGCEWRHVPTDQNPADYISRGVDINLLSTLDDWWSGPSFLKKEPSHWPSKLISFNHDMLPEIKSDVTCHVLLSEEVFNEIITFTRFSNLFRLQRTTAYIFRFIDNCRGKHLHGPFNTTELDRALNTVIRLSQIQCFKDYKFLLNNKSLPKKSELNKFNVFLDDNKIIRIRGRLRQSNFVYNKKHPILIHSTHHFTKLLFNYEHKRLFHAGPQLLLASIRERYWPIRGRNLARMCYRQCIRCCRFKGETVSPIMGDLPSERLQIGFPFENIALDYAGPIQSAVRQGRGCKLVKVYIAIFVCFSTKSIHLELVGDLTSNTFILALKRFISRRGKPRNIYSDNGTSFVGAYNDLSKFLKSNCDSVVENMAKEGIEFHFIPAYSPHFAGLAEAGVKSTKHHLVRVLGLCNLIYEELYTLLVQIEAILNSRPLTPLSSNPEDLSPLTPGHFLIGRPMTSLPSPDFRDHSINALNRFNRIELLRQHFWNRWSKEYVSELQLRMKWRASKGSLKLNTLVLLKEDNLPPLKWKLGRIVATYPGTDGVVRVADVKTSNGLLRRSFSKICPLPIYPETEDRG